MEVKLKKEFFESLVQLANSRFNISCTALSRERLWEAVKKRLANLEGLSLIGYKTRLENDENEWDHLWPALSRPGKMFFRHQAQFELLKDIIDDWAFLAEERKLNVLCLGCEDGFDLHSLAITLNFLGLISKGWDIFLYGADLNPISILKAKKSLYADEDISFLNKQTVKKWFTPRAAKWWFRSDQSYIKEIKQIKTYEPEFWPWPEQESFFNVIWARGQSWELSQPAAKSLSEAVRHLLIPGGILFTAPGEILVDSDQYFATEMRKGQIYFRLNDENKKRIVSNYQSKKVTEKKLSARKKEKLFPLIEPSLRAQSLLEAAAIKLAENIPEEARDIIVEVLDETQNQGIFLAEAWSLMALVEKDLNRIDIAYLISSLAVRMAPQSFYSSEIFFDILKIYKNNSGNDFFNKKTTFTDNEKNHSKWAEDIFKILKL